MALTADQITAQNFKDFYMQILPYLGKGGGGLPILFDEGGTERQVGWYRYANGTKKPVYEKCIETTFDVAITDGVNSFKTISLSEINIDRVIKFNGTFNAPGNPQTHPNGFEWELNTAWVNNDVVYYVRGFFDNDFKEFYLSSNSMNAAYNRPFHITICYTKTTDTPA